jgi:flagellar motor switch protein FliG
VNAPAVRGQAVVAFDSSNRPDAASVVRRLRSEHPQIIAAVLVRIDSALAAEVLRLMPDEMRNHIILRIATLNAIRPAAMKDLHDVLLFVLSAPQTGSQTAFGGIAAAGKIIGQLGGGMEATVLASLRDHDPDLAIAITTRLAARERRSGESNEIGDGAHGIAGHIPFAGGSWSGAVP